MFKNLKNAATLCEACEKIGDYNFYIGLHSQDYVCLLLY